MHFSIFSPNSNSPAKCPNRLGTLPAFRTYAITCGQTQIVVLKNSICYIDVPTVPLLSSGRTRSWSGHPFGPRFASTMEHVVYNHFYYSDICCIYIDTSYIYNFGLCTRFLWHCFLQTEGKHHQFMWANCPVKTKGLAWWKSRFDVWPILKMVQTTSSLRIGAYPNTKFCWYLENDWSFCVSCNRPSIFQLHKRHRSAKRTRPETNATKNPGQAMAVVVKRENYDGADGWMVVNYIFLNLLSCNLHQISQGTVYMIERWHSRVAPEFVFLPTCAQCIRWSNSYVDTSASEIYRCDREILCPGTGGLLLTEEVNLCGWLWIMYPSYSFVFYDVHLHII